MHIVAFGTDKPGMADVRREHFEAFYKYLRDHPDHPGVVLYHGGPTLSEDGSTRIGTLLVLDAPSVDAARAFISDSPYGRAELYGELYVRPLEWLTGKPE